MTVLSDPAGTVLAMDALTDLEQQILTFERSWWKYAGGDQLVLEGRPRRQPSVHGVDHAPMYGRRDTSPFARLVTLLGSIAIVVFVAVVTLALVGDILS